MISIRMKRRSAHWTRAFFFRSTVLLALTCLLIGAGYVLAEVSAKDPSILWRDAVANNPLVGFSSYLKLRTSVLVPAFAIAIGAFVILALAHFFTFGRKDVTAKNAKDAIPWWTLTERIVHAIVLVTFILLTLTGLSITFGRFLGGGTAELLMRQLHELSGFAFTPFIVIMVLSWVRHAIPRAYDIKWLKHAGGYLGYKGALKSGKFNAGQKLWFWIMAAASAILIWTGFGEYFQIGALPTFRMYVVLHFSAAVPIVLMFIVHLYMSSLGARGQITAMISGKVSKTAVMKNHSDAPDLRKVQPSPAGSDD
jgi:formate dehydrogenase subunit gamma